MRSLLAATLAATTLTLAVSFSVPVHADAAEPTVHEVYEAAKAGHYDQAQQMMDQVLKAHPKSAKAHYVQAELYAKQGKTAVARSELSQAEELEPGLPHENAQSVQALKTELGMVPRSSQSPHIIGMTSAPAAAHFPWGMVLIVVVAIGLLLMLFRRRSSYAQYPAGGAPAMGGGPGYGGPAGYGPGYGGPVGGGMGSGIAGGLASGLAVGAGVVAGEEIAHHFMDGNRETTVLPPAAPDNGGWDSSGGNADMGGNDFGVDDSGSWGDSGGGGDSGGDWS